MDASEQSRVNDRYQRHLRMLKLQSKSGKTIDRAWSRGAGRGPGVGPS
jgi:hypothetical protein